jgi:two-component system OmpR family response regulator
MRLIRIFIRSEARYGEPVQLLVIDDDVELCDVVVRALKSDGHVVKSCPNIADARTVIDESKPDLVVLDLELPDGNGVELCRELRMASNPIPVLVLTAHSELTTRVGSLDAGADDFLAKPFAVAELRARVRALGRRRAHSLRSFLITHGDLSLDFGARQAKVGAQVVELTAREWVILETLATEQGRVVRRADLLRQGWGEISAQASASLEVLIGRIRRKLGSELIRTQRSEGYSLGGS